MAENGMSAADIAAVTRPNYGYGFPGMGMGYGNMWNQDFIWIILIFALFMGNGFGGWGNAGGYAGSLTTDSGLIGYAIGNNATKTDLSEGLNSLQIQNKLDALTSQVDNGLDGVQMQLCQGFNSTQRELLQGQNAQNILALQNTASLDKAIDGTRFSLHTALENNRFDQQKCCCDIKTAIANTDNLNFRNTCDVLNAIKADGEATRAVLVANKISDLQEKLADSQRAAQTAQIEASQLAQTSKLIDAIRPTPIPAYLTCSPYMSSLYACNAFGLGNNFGCGFGSFA